MSSSSYGPTYPSTAYLLSLIGGIFIVLDGLLVVVAGLFLSSFIGSAVPGASAVVTAVIGFGILAIVLGLLIVVWVFHLKTSPASARRSGILIIVFSLISFLGGGGFYIGSILALIGGIISVTWRPPMASPPAYGPPGYGTSVGPSGAPLPWGPPASPPIRPGVPQRFCSSCGSPNVAGAQFCAKCGAPMS